jgi:6-phosphogluconolactonase
MNRGMIRRPAVFALVLALLGTFAWGGGVAEARVTPDVVFTQTNEASGNEVVAFARAGDGLAEIGRWETGGLGTGQGLGSQGALVLSENRRWLFAVNAGSDDISVFRLTPDGLTLADTAPSGGDRPISLTVHGNLLYVLNHGSDTIAGFRIGRSGALTPIDGSTRPLSGSGVNAAQVAFSPDGSLLVVTERATNRIDTYTIGGDGRASGPNVHPSAGQTPFGFAFRKDGTLVVSEAFGGAPDASATSSYHVSGAGVLNVVSGAVPTTETAACWAVVTGNGRYAYVTNTGSGTITGYRIAADGSLTLLDADGRTGVTGAGSSPVDEALSRDSRYLYVLEAGTDAISAFKVHGDGSLSFVSEVGGLPGGTTGLAVR